MSLLSSLRYHANVSVLGAAYLRLDRFKLAWQLKKPWQDEHLAPPLSTSPRLKELISRHYLSGRFANGNKKVAWVTSGAPSEFLMALGFYVLYPENHAVVCGTRKLSEELCTKAEDAGFSRDLCSYARADIGSVLSGKTPVGKLPRPDLLVCCTNICQTVLYWYRVLAQHFGVPLVVIDTPFVYAEPQEHAVRFVQQQIEDAVQVAERVAGRSLSPRRLEEVTARSKEAVLLWSEVLARGKHVPAPITAFDEFIHMAPVVEMRGEEFTVEYYRTLLSELDGRVARGEGAVKGERLRLLWDNLPIWVKLRWFNKRLAERKAALVASTYTNAWGELANLVDPSRPMESAARTYLQPMLNRGTGHKLATMRRMVGEYRVNGVILHSDRSCKPYSIGQMDQRERIGQEAGVPALLLEADHNDPRAFSEEQVATRLSAFLEVLEA